MSAARYPAVKGALPANDDDVYIIGQTHRTHRVALLDPGPYGFGHPALIPQASVMQADHYGDMGREPAEPIRFGTVLHFQGFGCYTVVATRNPDWPRLVPAEGPRFYATYEGHGDYRVRDREQQGHPVPWNTVAHVRNQLFGQPRPGTDVRDQHATVAAYLSATHKEAH